MVTEQDIKPWLRQPPRSYILTNASVVDTATGDLNSNLAVKLSTGKIQSLIESTSENIKAAKHDGYEEINCEGKFLTPGLIDSHVHLMAVPGFNSLASAFGNPNDVSVLRQPYVCAQMLHRGFTSVRDCGGALQALKEAVADGVFPGPRIFIAGHALSQAGGHADFRGPHNHDPCCGGATTGLGRVANGVPECMTAVREEIRTGANFIKIMGSGGVSSPTDRIEQLQFSRAEIQAMVECAENAGTFVTAHAYTSKAIRHCVENGVKGIEHGNFIDEETAKLCVEQGVYLTPTLVTYAEMASDKWKGYLPPESASKNGEVLTAGLQALKTAHEAGVQICYGTDLLGPLGTAQTVEFCLRSQVLSPLDVLKSATVTPARMMGYEDSLGQVKAGFEADILITDKNPLEDVTIFDEPDNVLGVIKEGRIYKSRWSDLKEDGNLEVRVRV